ncbi:MAG: FtsQ-type POTRA domain-containing protein, partial [Acutalibacteraceae bacterium]
MEKQQTNHRKTPPPQGQRKNPSNSGKSSSQRPPQKRRPPQNPPQKKQRKIKAPTSQKKRRHRRFLWYFCTIFVLLVICCILSMTLFFKIDSIVVDGKTRYDKEDILKHCGVEKGQNLILCDTETGAADIEKTFPYIEDAWIERKLFNSIIVHVKETKPASVVESNGKYVVLSKKGKILEIADTMKYDVPLLKGAKIKTAELSSTIIYEDNSLQKIIQEMIEAMESYGIENVREIDISNPANIRFTYNDRITILIGTPENIDYKLKTVTSIVNDKLDKNAVGILDVSLCTPEGGKSYFNPNIEESSALPSEPSGENSNPDENSDSGEDSNPDENSDSGDDSNPDENSNNGEDSNPDENSDNGEDSNPNENSDNGEDSNPDENSD